MIEEAPAAPISSPDGNSRPKPENNNGGGPICSPEDILACQMSSWYPIFSNLTKPDDWDKCNGNFRTNVTLKSIILDLPISFHEYLQEDQLILPLGAKTSSLLLQDADDRAAARVVDDWSSSSCSSNESESDDVENTQKKKKTHPQNRKSKDNEDPTKIHSFPELNQRIEDAIDSLYSNYIITDSSDKAVYPKLNWSSPKDAVWVNNGSAKCCTAGDVYMLLKASDFCSYDVNHALPELLQAISQRNIDQNIILPKLQLCLRKWCNLFPSQEFRCFVREKNLVAISQRNDSEHYPHLADPAVQEEYQNLIENFHADYVQPALSSRSLEMNTTMNSQLQNYVMDVYIDKKKKVWLVDFNVWDNRTDALLFTWPDLQQLQTTSLTMRVVETAKQVRANPLSSYKAPIDTLYMASSMNKQGTGIPNDDDDDSDDGEDDGSTPPQFANKGAFEQFMAMCQRPSSMSEDESDEEEENE